MSELVLPLMVNVALLAVYVGRHTSGSSIRVVLWSAWVTTPEGEAAMAAMSWREPLPPHTTPVNHTHNHNTRAPQDEQNFM